MKKTRQKRRKRKKNRIRFQAALRRVAQVEPECSQERRVPCHSAWGLNQMAASSSAERAQGERVTRAKNPLITLLRDLTNSAPS